MAIQPMSSEPVPSDFLDPDGRDRELNEDWEMGPVALEDTSLGLINQAWHLSFAGGIFTVSPETTGTPTAILTGQDSIQCTFAFDQAGRVSIAWQDSLNVGHLYWYDTTQGGYVVTDFATDVVGMALTLDDKRDRQAANSDIQLYYTLEDLANPGQYILYCRYQRDRFDDPVERANPTWPFIWKSGMHDGLRVQLETVTQVI